MVAEEYQRALTHKDYRNPDKLKRYYHRVKKHIYSDIKSFDNSSYNNSEYEAIDINFIVSKTGSLAAPLIYGGVPLAFFIVFAWPSDESLDGIDWFFMILCGFLFIFYVVYAFTMPKKEHILNRRDGLITMTGSFWQKNITMSFEKVEFAYSTGGEDGVGGFILQVIRPNKWQTFDTFPVFGADCYEDMSFITWYMDKNRPLPPGSAFDEFRDKDFERRKAEGFPRPLYPSAVETPEATPEQQAERKKIGGW